MGRNKGRIQTRTCVVCREQRQRATLIRLVRTPDGQVVCDTTGRLDGRGAYVCRDAEHWGAKFRSDAIDRGKLGHALKINIDDSIVNMLNEAIISQLIEHKSDS
jgi:predicted RNA-binding protein YlxR (DUF448 family)